MLKIPNHVLQGSAPTTKTGSADRPTSFSSPSLRLTLGPTRIMLIARRRPSRSLFARRKTDRRESHQGHHITPEEEEEEAEADWGVAQEEKGRGPCRNCTSGVAVV